MEDIGTHSIRKGATTHASSGSTASPSSVAINNQGGWTLGTVPDVYMLYEKAGAHYVGQILAGLPVLSARFAVSGPNFCIQNPKDANAQEKQTEFDGKVILALRSLFGDVICHQVMLLQILCVGLACILHHRKHLQQLCTATSTVSKTAIYTSREIFALNEHILIRYLSCKEESSFAVKLTGIPPHVAHLAAIRFMRGELQALGPSMLKEFEKLLDGRTFGDVLSES